MEVWSKEICLFDQMLKKEKYVSLHIIGIMCASYMCIMCIMLHTMSAKIILEELKYYGDNQKNFLREYAFTPPPCAPSFHHSILASRNIREKRKNNSFEILSFVSTTGHSYIITPPARRAWRSYKFASLDFSGVFVYFFFGDESWGAIIFMGDTAGTKLREPI